MKTIEPLTKEQREFLDNYKPPTYAFSEDYVRRKGYVATDYAGTVARSKSSAKRDKFAIKAMRADGVKPFEAAGWAYRNAGLVDNLRRF
jgi:hypothetical protein